MSGEEPLSCDGTGAFLGRLTEDGVRRIGAESNPVHILLLPLGVGPLPAFVALCGFRFDPEELDLCRAPDSEPNPCAACSVVLRSAASEALADAVPYAPEGDFNLN